MMTAHFGAWRAHIAAVVFDMDDRGANKTEARKQPDPEQRLMDLLLKRGKLPASADGGAADVASRRAAGSEEGERRPAKTWPIEAEGGKEGILPPVIRCGPCALCF